MKTRLAAAAALAAAFVLVCAAAPALAATAGYVTVYGSHLSDSTGTPVANATISFAPVSNAGTPISYRIGPTNEGQAISSAVTALVTNGAFTIALADSAITNPANLCYSVTVTDNTTGNSILGPGYACVQPTAQSTGSLYTANSYWCSPSAASCDFDEYIPSTSPQAVIEVAPLPEITLGTVVVAAGESASATLTGTPADYFLNLSLPAAPAQIDVNAGLYGVVADGATDDTAAWNAAITAVLNAVQIEGINAITTNGPTLRLPSTGKLSIVSSTLNWPLQLNGSGLYIQKSSSFSPVAPLLRVGGQGTGSGPYGTISHSAFYGSGTNDIGALVEIVSPAVSFHFDEDEFTGTGGICFLDPGVERIVVANSKFYFCRWPIDQWGASNETQYTNNQVMYSRGTSATGLGGTASYYYSPNAPGGLPTCPWSQSGTSCTATGGTPTPIQPVNYGAAITLAGQDIIHLSGPGSTKAPFLPLLSDTNFGDAVGDEPKLQVLGSLVDVEDHYFESGGPSPDMMVGGQLVYSRLTAAFPATAYSVPVDSILWQPYQADSAQYLVDSSGLWIFPDDYCGPSLIDHTGAACSPTDNSDIDASGTLKKGMSEVVNGPVSGFAYNGTTPTFYSGNSSNAGRGQSGGCSEAPFDATDCALSGHHNAISWTVNGSHTPVVTMLPYASHVSVKGSHFANIDRPDFYSPLGGYAFTPNDAGIASSTGTIQDQGAISSDVVAGWNVDGYAIQMSNPSQFGANEIQFYGPVEGFNDGTFNLSTFPPLGRVTCPTNCVIGLGGAEDPLEEAMGFDSQTLVYTAAETYNYGFPSQIVPVAYPNGVSSCVIVHGYHEYNSCNNKIQQPIAPDDPQTGVPQNGTQFTGSIDWFGAPYPTPQVTPSLAAGSSSIAAGTYSTSEFYVASQISADPGYPPAASYAINAQGSNYNGTEQMFVGANCQTSGGCGAVAYQSPLKLAITSSSYSGSTFSAVTSTTPSGIFAVGAIVGLYGYAGGTGLANNGCFVTVTSLATTSPYGFSGTVYTTNPGTGCISVGTLGSGGAEATSCPGYTNLVGLAPGGGGAIQSLGAALTPGFCSVPPGTTAPAVIYPTAASSGSGASITMTVQGLQQQPNAPISFQAAAGSLVTVASPAADSNGGAVYWGLCAGPVGNMQVVQTAIPIGTAATLSSMTTALTYSSASSCPATGLYGTSPRSRFHVYNSLSNSAGSSGISVDFRPGAIPTTWTNIFAADSTSGVSVGKTFTLTLGGGSTQIYRCLTAGTARAGTLTSVASDCGSSVAIKLVTP